LIKFRCNRVALLESCFHLLIHVTQVHRLNTALFTPPTP
jgi:hypothetical protein